MDLFRHSDMSDRKNLTVFPILKYGRMPRRLQLPIVPGVTLNSAAKSLAVRKSFSILTTSFRSFVVI